MFFAEFLARCCIKKINSMTNMQLVQQLNRGAERLQKVVSILDYNPMDMSVKQLIRLYEFLYDLPEATLSDEDTCKQMVSKMVHTFGEVMYRPQET